MKSVHVTLTPGADLGMSLVAPDTPLAPQIGTPPDKLVSGSAPGNGF